MSTLIQVSADSSLKVGTTPITLGTIGRVLFQGTGNVLQQSSNLFWDNTNNALTITTGKTFSAYQSSQPNDALKITASNDGAVFGVQNSNAIGFSGIEYLSNTGVARVFTGFNNGNGQEFRFNNFATGGYIDFLISTSALRIANTRNILIGTTTDAGYKLDVNGTARVQGRLTVSTSGASITSSASQGFEVFDQYGTRNFMSGVEVSGGIQVGNSSLGSGLGRWVSIVQSSGQTSGYGGIQFFNDNAATSRIGSIGIFSGVFRLQTTSTDVSNQTALIATSSTLYLGYNTYSTLPSSAAMAIQSTTQGFLPPRMTTTQKNAIASPAAGLVVYDTTLNKLCVYTTAWETITSV